MCILNGKKHSRFFIVCTEMCTNNNHVTNQVITVFQKYIKKQRLSSMWLENRILRGRSFLYTVYSSSTIILDAFLVGLCDFKTSRIPFLYVAIF